MTTCDLRAGGGLSASNAARLAVTAALPQLQQWHDVPLPRDGQRARPQLAALQLATIPLQVGHPDMLAPELICL